MIDAAGRFLFAMVLGVALVGCAYGIEECGSMQNAYGPFDYWTDKDKLGIVEGAHFTSEVENLRGGKSGYIGGDIDYTLRAFPNHPRALLAMIRLGEKERKERPGAAHYTVTCYLDRAIRFRPDDGMVRMIYGAYLAKHKKSAEALEQLEMATKSAGDNANLHYNLGLVYLDLRRYDEALAHAHLAYRLGFNLPGLKSRLEKAGHWRDPEPPAPEATTAAKEGESTPAANASGAAGKEVTPSSVRAPESKPEGAVEAAPTSGASPVAK